MRLRRFELVLGMLCSLSATFGLHLACGPIVDGWARFAVWALPLATLLGGYSLGRS